MRADQIGFYGFSDVVLLFVFIISHYNGNDRTDESDGYRTQDRGQRTEDKGTEDRGERTEVRGQRTEDRGQRTEDRGQMTEDRTGDKTADRT